MFSLMLFMFFFFCGFAALFFYSIHRQKTFFHTLSDEHAQLRVLLRALESRLDHLEQQNNPQQAAEKFSASNSVDDTASIDGMDHGDYDPLLHLSFEEPAAAVNDPKLDLHFEVGETRKTD